MQVKLSVVIITFNEEKNIARCINSVREIADEVVAKGLWNLSSHQSDPVSAAAVSAVIDIVREEGLIDKASESGNYFIAQLQELSLKMPAVARVRGQGLMIGFDLIVDDPERTDTVVNDFMFGCRRRGVHITYGYGGINFRIIPPLVISRSEIDFAVEVIGQSAEAAVSGRHSTKEHWPRNPYTSRLFETRSYRRLLQYCWRSSPAEVVEKGKDFLQKSFGRRT